MEVRVASVSRVADGVVEFHLVPVDGCCPDWEPGAHIDLVLPSGTIRQYSLCSSPGEDSFLGIAVQAEPGGRGGSLEAHRSLTVGCHVTISGPRNHFRLQEQSSYEFVAGGIGITPILPMIEAVRAAGKPWRLWYGGRTRSRMAFLDRLDAVSCGHVVTAAEDEVGREDFAWVAGLAADVGVYACGPPGLLDVLQQASARGRATLVVERFTGAQVPANTTSTAFEVQLGEGGPTATVPAGGSVLDAVLGLGGNVEYSCEEGVCGTCATRVIAGEPDHRDTLLSEDERAEGLMLVCVSGARSQRLVLALQPRSC